MIESFKLPTIIPENLTGSIVSFNDEYGGLPLKSCVSQISGYQEGSGTPSPSNVRPLHAWSGANLTACGVNLWDGEYTPNTWISETSTGATAPHTGTGVTDYIPIVGGTSYYKFDTGSSRASYFDMNKNCIGGGIASGAGVITTPANAYYVRFTITDEKISSFGINYPSTDTDYHAYNGNTHLFTFGTAIYSGYIDWKRGVVVGTHGIVDLGSLTWLYNTQYANPLFYTNLAGAKLTPSDQKGDTLAEIFETYSARNMNTAGVDYAVAISEPYFFSSYNLYIVDSDYTDPTAFKTAMNGVMLAYELATPIEIPLVGINLLTQEGVNNIFCDTGDTEVKRLKVN